MLESPLHTSSPSENNGETIFKNSLDYHFIYSQILYLNVLQEDC
jgi:hypothetical protein